MDLCLRWSKIEYNIIDWISFGIRVKNKYFKLLQVSLACGHPLDKWWFVTTYKVIKLAYEKKTVFTNQYFLPHFAQSNAVVIYNVVDVVGDGDEDVSKKIDTHIIGLDDGVGLNTQIYVKSIGPE